MKFHDGNWLVRKGLQLLHPVGLHSLERHDGELRIRVAPKDVSARHHQLDVPLFTVRLWSPAEGVVGVRFEHHAGGYDCGPHFELAHDPQCDARVVEADEFAELASGPLTVRVARRGDWAIDFYDGDRRLTGVGHKAGGYAMEDATGTAWCFESLDLGVGEQVYGLGERFTPFVKNGQVVDIWNADGGTSSEQAYKNVPFYLSSRGYGVFVNSPRKVSFEVGSERVAKVQFSVEGEALEYYLIAGPQPKDVLDRYTRLTGRPALPPAWSWGLWLTTSFTTDYDEATVTRIVDGMRERDIPLHVFHFDCFWMRPFQWCDFEWDPATFPDPPAMLARLKAQGLKICVWINPYIAQASPLFAEGKRRHLLLERPDGRVWQWDRWQPGQALVDFTNPEARAWYAGHLQRLVEMGVDCFKTDFGERIPTDVVWHDGADPQGMHNYYTQLYNQVVFDVLERTRGRGEAVLFARSATAGGQKFPVHWGGDNSGSFDSMAESLRGGLSLGLSGFGYWSHDIGGFEATASAAVYKRWCAFGLLSSHSRLHGSKSYRVPWMFDDEAVAVLRQFTQLKCRLMPYLMAASHEAHRRGTPVMRAMLLEFPHDPAVLGLDRQYMLGESLLVAPVFDADGSVDFYLPPGRWTHLLSGEGVEGGRWRRERHGYLSLPLYLRPNTLLALGTRQDRPDYRHAEEVEFHLHALEEGARAQATIPGDAGERRVAALRSGRTLTLETAQPDLPAVWVLHGGARWHVQSTGAILGTVQGEALRLEVAAGVGTVRLLMEQSRAG